MANYKRKVKKAVRKRVVRKSPVRAKKRLAKKAAKKPATKGVAPRTTRTPAQRAADKKKLMNQMSEARGMSKTASGMTKELGRAAKATKFAIGAATLPLGGVTGRAISALGKAGKAARAAKANPFKAAVKKKSAPKRKTARKNPFRPNPFQK